MAYLSPSPLTKRILPLLMGLLLYALAALAWLFPIPMIFDLNLYFVTLFLFIALRLFGLRWALTMAVSLSAGFILLMDMSPSYALIVVEVGVVGLLQRRGGPNLLLSDLIYWLTAGWLLTAGTYYADMGTLGLELLLFLFKQMVNGAFCALLAGMAMAYLPVHQLTGQSSLEKCKKLSLRQILFHMIMTAVMVPFILFILIISWYQYSSITDRTEQLAASLTLHLRQELQTWQVEELDGLRLQSLVQLSRLSEVMQRSRESTAAQLYIVNSRGTIAASSDRERLQQPWILEEGELMRLQGSLYFWKPLPGESLYSISAWQRGSYYYTEELPGLPLTIVVEVPMRTYLEEMQTIFVMIYGTVLLFILLAAAATLYISQRFLRVISRLGQATADLPDKLKQQEAIDWPSSRVVEIQRLTNNFQVMSDELLAMFLQSVRLNSILRTRTEQLQRSEEQLQHLAYYDMLTDLPNRLNFSRHLQECMELELAEGEAIAVLFLDLDRFKQINDTMGHAAGDELLVEVAQRLQSSVPDTRIFRLGGDEFVVVTEAGPREAMERTAEQVLEALRSPLLLAGQELLIKCSIGISVYPQDAQDLDTIIKNADAAMYEAKEQGGHQYVFFDSSMDGRIQQRMKMEQALHRALEQNELELYYQPKYDGTTHHMTGVEALLRWNHPERGSIPPAQFIPLAEETGEICRIGQWVLRQACLEVRKLQQQGHPDLTVAVNLSPRQLDQSGLVEQVRGVLEETGLAPEHLMLEITEDFLVRNQAKAAAAIDQFKAMGIGIAIDDFGMGYSSFAQLKRVLPHTLKIDRSFIRRIDQDGSNASIVKALVQMAHALQLKVVLEGVETEAELNYISGLHCDELQGFFFSKPVPLHELQGMLRGMRVLRSAEPWEDNMSEREAEKR